MSVNFISRLFFYTKLQHPPSLVNLRFYSRWMHRKPGKVVLPFQPSSNTNIRKENIIDLSPEHINLQAEELKPRQKGNAVNTKPTSQNKNVEVTTKRIEKIKNRKEKIIDLSPEYINAPEENLVPVKQDVKSKSTLSVMKSAEITSKRLEKLKKRKFYLSQKRVFDENKEIIFEKMKENDGRISSLLTNVKSRKDRLHTQQMMVEGWRLIVDGLEAKCHLKYVIFSRIEDLNNLKPFLPNNGVIFYKIPYKEMELWSNVETSPGIIGLFEMPTHENVKRISKPLPLQFICDNVRVPGNLGTILRIAVAAGCDKVLLTKGCVDMWDPKVIRSAAGAHFRLPIHNSVEWEDIPKYLENTSLFVADSNATIPVDDIDDNTHDQFQGLQVPVLPYYGLDYAKLKHISLIIGGETEGISEESYRLAASTNGLRLNIPLHKGVDSLNTGMAAAVIAFEIRKQFIQEWARLKSDKQLAEAL